MKTARTTFLLVLTPVLVSWVLSFSFPYLADWSGLQDSVGRRSDLPDVPFVLAPQGTTTHVRSSVYYLLIVIGYGVLCMLPLEISKYSSLPHPHGRWLYAGLLLQQMLISLDLIRSHAWDWWLFLLSVTHVHPIDKWTWAEGHFSVIGAWPWPSGISALVLASMICITRRPAVAGR